MCTEIEIGMNENAMKLAMSGVATPLERANAINKLISMGKIELCRQGNQLVYRLKEGKAKGDINAQLTL